MKNYIFEKNYFNTKFNKSFFMNKTLFHFFIVVFAMVSIVSCDIEPIDPAINLDDIQDPNNPTNPVDPGVSSGDYWPRAINNEWFFEQTGTNDITYKMIGTDVFNGQTYYKFAPISVGTASSDNTWLNKNGASYTFKYGDVTFDAGGLSGSITGFEVLFLKDDLAVNETWSGTFTQTTTYTGIPPINQSTNYVGTILAKDVTETVDGETYNDVIKSKIVQTTSFSGVSTVTTTEYWFAKDVGPIRIYTTQTGNSTTYEAILTDYILN